MGLLQFVGKIYIYPTSTLFHRPGPFPLLCLIQVAVLLGCLTLYASSSSSSSSSPLCEQPLPAQVPGCPADQTFPELWGGGGRGPNHSAQRAVVQTYKKVVQVMCVCTAGRVGRTKNICLKGAISDVESVLSFSLSMSRPKVWEDSKPKMTAAISTNKFETVVKKKCQPGVGTCFIRSSIRTLPQLTPINIRRKLCTADDPVFSSALGYPEGRKGDTVLFTLHRYRQGIPKPDGGLENLVVQCKNTMTRKYCLSLNNIYSVPFLDLFPVIKRAPAIEAKYGHCAMRLSKCQKKTWKSIAVRL